MPAWDGRTMSGQDWFIIDQLLKGRPQAELARELKVSYQYITDRIDTWRDRGLIQKQPLYALTEQWRERWERMKSE